MGTYQLIALDMDGTLLNSKKQISPANLTAIKLADKQGKIVVLSTGRNPAEVRTYTLQMPSVRYLNCNNGSLIYDVKVESAIYQHPLAPETVMKILKITEKEDVTLSLATDHPIIQRDHFAQMEQYGMGPYKGLFAQVAEKWEDLRYKYAESPFPVHKVNIYHKDTESRARVQQSIADAGVHAMMIHSETTSLEISAEGVGKGTGLQKLCEFLNIPIADTIAVGDSGNDLQVLNTAGLAVAMGNAIAEIKKIADVVTADCDHDGCAEAINQYLLNPRNSFD